jgi:hypothetical protein
MERLEGRMKLWKAVQDNGMYIYTYIVMADTAEEAVRSIPSQNVGRPYGVIAEDFQPLGAKCFISQEDRWSDA